ncbi:MAG TPA: SDR family NAD(P)-dependent oxidoreductase, partial [Ruminiclostridium sp.]|nr:SDR family NAD(P)-dependent oxidoreductase [Ruminiclostridium sp.]
MNNNLFKSDMKFPEYEDDSNDSNLDGYVDVDDLFISDDRSCCQSQYENIEEVPSDKNNEKQYGHKECVEIAVIGISGRFPGASNVNEFWDNLANGICSIKQVPGERWDISKFYDPEAKNEEKTYLDRGGFIDDSDKFDSLFFNISGKEAELTDPQQRVFFEESWHALEDAGYSGKRISDASCGVFVGVKEGDYQICLSEVGAAHEAQAFWGNDTSIVPARLSYFLNLRGPSIAVNTACSSSLTAIHMACESIYVGKCDMAVAGGVFVSHTPGGYIISSNASMLSHDGKCKAFDDRADGFVPGEAVGAVVLKPLDKALADRDYVYAVIKGFGINQDGRTNGITAPSHRAQAELEQKVYERAAVNPETIGYVETHGTGTKLGDPIEFEALTDSFRKFTDKTGFCAIGSVKTNIGHAAAAAGVASFIKVIMALKNKKIPPSLNFEKPNKFIKFDGSPFFVNTGLIDWKRLGGGPRRGAVSAFGFSGTNVHILLEEMEMQDYVAEEMPLPCFFIPLSAKTKEALQTKVSDLIEWLEGTGKGYSMSSIAYTLQAGRDHYAYRISFIADDRISLLQQLRDCDLSMVKECNIIDARGENDKLAEQYDADITPDMDNGDYINEINIIKEKYINGETINWDILYFNNIPYKVPMPLYPFARKSFWLRGTALPQRKSLEALHPLIDSVLPKLLDHEVLFKKTFNSNDIVVSNHQVKSQYLLPGVAYLEMAHAAAKLLDCNMGFQLRDVVWLTPVVVEKNGDKEVNISLKLKDNYYEYEVTGDNGEALYSKGEVHPVSASAGRQYVPIEEIKGRSDTEINKDELYNRFQRLGLNYGEYLKSVTHIWSNGREVLASLELPLKYIDELKTYAFHPAIMDGSIQAVIGLVKNGGEDIHNPRLPFSVDCVTILNPLKASGYVYIKPLDEEHFNLAVLDGLGCVCIKMENLTLRQYKDRKQNFLFKPEWVEEILSHADSAALNSKKVVIVYTKDGIKLKDHIRKQHKEAELFEILLGYDTREVSPQHREISSSDKNGFYNCKEFLGGADLIYFLGGIQTHIPSMDDLKFLRQSQEEGVLSLYRLVKALNMSGACDESLKLKIITNNTFSLNVGEMDNPFAGSIQGFALTLAKEYSHWEVSCVDIDINELDCPLSNEWITGWVKQAITEPGYELGQNVLLRRMKRYVRRFMPVELPECETLPFRNGGVYMILGGAGGIGLELAAYLAETVKAKLALIGRSALKPAQEEKINHIMSLGGDVLYLQADGTDYDSMVGVVAKVKERFGQINGAFHSAIVLKDKTLANMDEDTFRSALSPKTEASMVLYKVLRDEPIDFLVYFSSIQSFTGNAGQGNYAAGCTFKDSYAHALSKIAPFKVRIINWGYWGTVGVVSSEQYYRRFTSQGALSIEPNEGFDAVSRIVSAPLCQVMAFKAKKDILDMMGVNWNNKIEFQKPAIPSCIELLIGKLTIDDSNASPVNMDEAFKILENFGRKLLLGYFKKSGYLLHSNEQHVISDMKEKMGVIPEYYRLFDALIDILRNAGWIRTDGSKIVTLQTIENAGIATQDEKDELSALYPDMAAHLNLLWVCINEFENVLSGKVNHMEVMFPGGSASLVEKIYKGDRMSDYFNRLTAQILKEYVKERIKNDPEAVTRIIEVGAGTGGTSAFVLKALNELKCSKKIRYYYTDISNGFIKYAENTFGHQYPFIEFKMLNIEDEPAAQGFKPGDVDVVFASNVVHATKSMPNTLNQIKKLLKKNGLLVINEATRKQDFGTLTFGLTSGWWLFDDVQNRIPNSPLLSPEGWRNILKAEGFDKIHTFGVPGMDSDMSYQSIIISESTGEIRSSVQFAKSDCNECKNIKGKPEENVVRNSYVESVKAPVKVSGETLHELTIDYLKSVFAEILRINKDDIEKNATFEKYGIDSLIVMEITKRLEKDFKKLSATLLFENPTIEELAAFLLKEKQDILEGLFASEQTDAPAINTQEFDTDNLFPANGVKIPPSIQKTENTAVMDSKRMAADQKEDIAIIGISGRYPLSDSLEEFWSNLEQGRNCITEIPKDRWNCDEYFQEEQSEPGKSYSKWGGFIKDHDKFDTFFFNISPLEAEAIDPQERLFLETAWSAMEDAGYSRHNVDRMDNQIGVFVGVTNGNYESIGGEEWGKGNFTGAHSSYWSVANRVSYFFNVQGPSMVIDTACSSSLTAIHLACESIKRGECKAAIAGGVNLIVHPMHYAKLTGMKMLSKGGVCRAFGDGADGFVDGEGVGAVLLKPLNKAIEDGDNIYAVIKGSFVNSGGKTSGYTVPNPNAQAGLIEEALKRSGVEPISISYVEAHGTGTALGDPIEVTGLKKAFHAATDNPAAAKLLDTQYCAIGSVKSNIGHLESASGIAGLTKLILMFKNKKLVASINSEVLNHNIDFEDSPFYVVKKETEWKKPKYEIESVTYEYPRRAGISSFGAGGANAHVILEEYEDGRPHVNNDEDQVVVLSAKNESRLREYAVNLKCFVEKLLYKDKTRYSSNEKDIKAVCDSLIKTIAEILEVPEESIDPSEEWEALGLNNFTVNEFIKRIDAEFKVKLKPNTIFQIQSIIKLADYIAENHDAQADGIKNDRTFSYNGDINLSDIAFTLQTGREPMPERLAIVASDLRVLCSKLEEFIRDGSGIEGVFHGNIKLKNEGLEGVFDEKGGRDLTLTLLEERRLKALAKLWVSGVDVEWSRLARSVPARVVSVPTYPFARERYWVKRKSNRAGSGEAPMHNLIDRVIPLLADNSVTFEKIFLPSDPIVEHHKVNNQKILPGVGYLAMANAAIRRLFPGKRNCINRVVWLNPVVVDEQPKAVNITISKCGEQLEYEVASQNKDTKIVHSKGTFGNVLPDNDIQYIKLDEIKARCKTNITGEELYSTYSEMGIQYGEYYRTVKKIWGNAEEVLGLLDKTVNKPWPDEDSYTDTGILDGALQAILALMAMKGNADKTLRIPFSVDKVEFLAPIKLPMYAHVSQSEHDGFNLVLADEKGRICVRFTEVTSRILNQPKTDITYAFKWVQYQLEQTQVPENGGRNVLIIHSGNKKSIKLKTDLEELHTRDRISSFCLDENPDSMTSFINNCSTIDVVYFIAGVSDYTENWNNEDCLAYAQKYGVTALLRLVKLLAAHIQTSSKLVLKIVVNETYPVFHGDEIYPLFAGLTGMSKSIAKEFLNWNISCIDISTGQPEEVLGIVREPAHKNGEDIALRNGHRYLRMIEPLKMEAPDCTNLRKGGVYMIVGGAGGIGLTFAGYLAEKYGARIALVGRSELSNIQRDKITSIKAKGSNVLYLKADVTDLVSMKEAIQSVKKELGAINGVFHSAIVLKDSTIINMDETILNKVLSPKVKGSLILNKALEGEKLDFLVFFSSAQSFMGNAGQGNYAAACTFKDSYAHYLNSVSSYPVKIINWGYWGSVGVVASDNYRKRLAEKGLLSIEPAEGCEVFEAFLANPLDQVVVLKADVSLQKSMRIDPDSSKVFYKSQYKTLFHEKSRIVVPEMKDPKVLEELQSSVKELERLAGWLLVDTLRKEHIIQEHATTYNMDELKERLKIVPKYDRLFYSLFDILERGAYCRVENQKIGFIALKDNSDLASVLEILPSKKEEIINRYPAIKAQTNLLWTCMLRFREVLTGGIEATEVIFPDSSMELVEGIYRDNPMADELNKLVAQAVRLFVTSCSPLLKEKRPLTILEIGAGTGGTSKLVLEALKETGIEVRYIYTDISQSFILYGNKTFGSQYRFVDFKVLDIEKNIIDQGIEQNSVDLVIAANVLHATRNLRYTLQQVKTVLRPNGWLVLNEATQLNDPTTLTFGLLEGWWLYEDEDLRIPNSPLLSANMWEVLLKEEGFKQTFPVLGEGAQNIILAESDGGVLIRVKPEKVHSASIIKNTDRKFEQIVPLKTVAKPGNIKERILGITAKVLQTDAQSLSDDVPFTDFGVDSILAVEIVNQINSGLGISLRATDLFNYSSIAALSGYIEEQWGNKLQETEAAIPENNSNIPDNEQSGYFQEDYSP